MGIQGLGWECKGNAGVKLLGSVNIQDWIQSTLGLQPNKKVVRPKVGIICLFRASGRGICVAHRRGIRVVDAAMTIEPHRLGF